MNADLKNIINSLTYEVGAEFIRSEDVERIAEAYSKLQYAAGYRQGYMDRSDEIYDHEMFVRYHEFFGKQDPEEEE